MQRLIVAATVAAFLTGASGADAQIAGNPATAASPAAGSPAGPSADGKISDGVVKIGLLLDMSGPYSSVTGIGSATAARMAVEDFGGKVDGKPIEIVVADHHNNPNIAGDIARKWFDHEHVDAVMDVSSSSPALAVQAIAHTRNKIVSLSAPGALRLTNEACSPTAVHYVYDTYALAHTIGATLTKRGNDTWFFITVDYSFGYDLEGDTAAVVEAAGGKVLGHARYPLDTTDFTSYVLRAEHSKAKVVAFANAGTDAISLIKQAHTAGMPGNGQTPAALDLSIDDVNALGLASAQGMRLAESFYWDLNDATRAWSKRFFDRVHKMPNSLQAGVYSSTLHYLQAVAAVGTDATDPVMAAMRSTPIHDFFASNGHIRADGVMVHHMHVFAVKKPSESHYPWDYYKLVETIPGDQAFQPLDQSRCPLVQKSG